METFGFEAVEPTFTQELKGYECITTRLDFINSLLPQAGKDKAAVAQWCTLQTSIALGSLENISAYDAKALVSVAQIEILSDVYLVTVAFHPPLIKLGHALHTAETVSLLTATAESTATWNTVIDRCLGAVLSQWSVAMHARYDYMHSNPHKVMRVIDALELFLSAERLDFCDKLFASVLETQNQDDLRKELREFWEPNSAKL